MPPWGVQYLLYRLAFLSLRGWSTKHFPRLGGDFR
jgi:hypothetical protein